MYTVLLGYWINKYAGWHKTRQFTDYHMLVKWLIENGQYVESIDYIV